MSNYENENNSINNLKTKKISFFSAILVVMGSSIGAGIFFKSNTVLQNSQQSLVLAIFCWIIAASSVIAMALALVEVSSARNDNLSLIGWAKVFNSRTTFKAAKNFMFYIYMPLTYFFMPLYVIMSLQDGIGALTGQGVFKLGTNVDWLIWTLVSMVMVSYFIFVSGLSSKIGNIQNKIITYIKFIPLAFVTIVGIVLVALNAGGKIHATVQWPEGESIEKGASIVKFAPGLGMFMAMSAIFFAYDGFYVVAGIQTEMKEPKKTPMAILIGLLVTTIIYLFVAISMSINGGSFPKIGEAMGDKWGTTGRVLFGIVNIMIAIGVMGILNGFAMWAPRFAEDLIKEGELPFSYKYKDKLNDNKPIIGIYYTSIISLVVVVIFTLIGALAYIDDVGYGLAYGSNMGKLYSFADLMGTWTALFTFGFITMSIYGCLRNRKKSKINTERKKYFVPAAIISISLISLALIVTVTVPFIDLFLLPMVNKQMVIEEKLVYEDIVVSRIMLIVLLILFVGASYLPTIIENKIFIKKFGSIENYEKWQKENFDVN